MDSVDFIGNNIKEINISIDNAIKAINETMNKVKEGTEIANKTMETFNSIISSIKPVPLYLKKLMMLLQNKLVI